MIFIAALRKEMIEQWRTYRLLVVVIVLTFFGMTSPLIAKLTPELMRLLPNGEDIVKLMPAPGMADAIGQYIKNTSQFALLLALFTTMGVVAQEKERGTAVLVLVKPLGRGAFLSAKFVAQALTFLVAIAVAGVAGYYYTVFIFGAPDGSAWLVMNILLWLYTLVYVAVTLLASTVATSQAVAAAAGFGALLVLSALGALPAIGRYLPGQLVAWATLAFTDSSATFFPALGVSLAIIAACLIAAWVIFEGQEI